MQKKLTMTIDEEVYEGLGPLPRKRLAYLEKIIECR